MNIRHWRLSLCLVLIGCGRASPDDLTAVVRGEGDEARDDSSQVVGESSSGETAGPNDVNRRLLEELAQLPRLDMSESARVAPNCEAPTSVGLSEATYGARAARLLWDQETGECLLEDVDRSPEGMLGILTLRIKDERAAISSVGKWKFYAPAELDLSDVTPGKPFTVYPYLGDWQFVATLEHNTELVKLKEFAYLRGDGPARGGERTDLEDQAPSDFVPPTICAPKPEGSETP